MLAGDFNVQIGKSSIDDFLEAFGAKNLVKDFTCFKSANNPSCIDLFITNSWDSFKSTATVSTGLSDFHKMIMIVTVFIYLFIYLFTNNCTTSTI